MHRLCGTSVGPHTDCTRNNIFTISDKSSYKTIETVYDESAELNEMPLALDSSYPTIENQPKILEYA